MAQWQLGIGASCLGSLLGTVGVQWRILSVSFEGRKGWTLELSGWVSWLSGQALGQVAIALAPATIAACLSFSGTLLWNALLAPVMLQEKLTKLHGLGVLLLTSGALLVMRFSSHTSQEYTSDRFLDLALRAPFVGLAFCLYGLAVWLVAQTYRTRDKLDIFSFSYVFALCGATDLTVTKFALQVVGAWTAAKSPHPSTALTISLTSALLCNHLAILWFQVAVTRYGDALQNIPLLLGSGFIMQVVFSGTFYDEFSEFDICRSAILAFGLAIMLVGMAVTSHASSGTAPKEQNEPLLNDDIIKMLDDLPPPQPGTPRNMRHWRANFMFNMDVERTMMCFSSTRRKLKDSPPLPRSFSLPGETPTRNSSFGAFRVYSMNN